MRGTVWSTLVVLLATGCTDASTVASRPGESPAGSPSAVSPSEEPGSPTPSRSPAKGPPPAPGTVVTTGDSAYGTMLFDAGGQAIYLFDKETTSRPECYGACAAAWPPVLTSGPPGAGGAARDDLLGTVRRRDGTTQVTYAGQPLYFYAHEGPGQVLCHDVVEYGGLWLVVTPGGPPAA